MFDVISFSCVALLDKAMDGDFHTLIVSPRVNGCDLLPGGKLCFDAKNVLIQGIDSGPFHPFNCGCGTPECAGLWSKVTLDASNGIISWIFPSDPYREFLDEGVFAGRESLCLRFEEGQYRKAMEDLLDSMVQMEKAHGMVNYYCGPIFALEELRTPVKERLVKDRDYMLSLIKQKAERAKLYCDLFGATVRIGFTNGAELAMRVEDMAQAVALKEAKEKYLDPRTALVDIVKKLIGKPDEVVALAKSLSWDETWNLCWTNNSGDVSEDEMDEFHKIVERLYPTAAHNFDYAK